MAWAWWVGTALVLGIVEMLSLGLFALMLVGGALAAGLAAALGASLTVQTVVAAVVSLLLVLALRPWLLRRWRKRVPLVETNVSALVGREAIVVDTTTPTGGRVKLAGEVWSARADDGVDHTPGTAVVVRRIEGATAVVVADRRRHSTP